MNIVFLDIDGVLVTARSLAATKNMRHLDEEAVSWLNLLCSRAPGLVRVVISSTWRRSMNRSQVEATLGKFGFDRTLLHTDWCTVSLDQGTRGHEIAEWLQRHPEVARFVILDDDKDFLSSQLSHHVRTTFARGFLEPEFQKAVVILDGGTPHRDVPQKGGQHA